MKQQKKRTQKKTPHRRPSSGQAVFVPTDATTVDAALARVKPGDSIWVLPPAKEHE